MNRARPFRIDYPRFGALLFGALLFSAPPTFAQTGWQPSFTHAIDLGTGCGDRVQAVGAGGGSVYVGGDFFSADGNPVWNIVKWTNGTWSAMGKGVFPEVHAITVRGDGTVFVGGRFTFELLDNDPLSRFAYFNGTKWTDAGGGVNNTVYALASAPGNVIYLAGAFTQANGAPIAHVARWNGNNFSAFGSGLINGTVYDVHVDGNHVYVAGDFAIPTPYIAHHTGSSFEFFAETPNGRVRAVTTYNGDMYIGGNFTMVGSVPAAYIARWDGNNWHAVATSMVNNVVDRVYGLHVVNGSLYAGGGFTEINGVVVNRLGKWNGSSWNAVGSGLSSTVFALGGSSQIWAGGDFTSSGDGGWSLGRVAASDGDDWGFGGANSSVAELTAKSNGNIVAAGGFTAVGNTLASGLAEWNGSTWSPISTGVSGSIREMIADGNDVIIAGYFSYAGGVNVPNVAHWDGATFNALASGTAGPAYALYGTLDDLYVGGDFGSASGVVASNIAHWNGSTWSGFSSSIDAPVRAIEKIGTDVYVGGSFTEVDGVPTGGVARWDGSSWHPVGNNPLQGNVRDLILYKGKLHATGDFTSPPGIARLDGSTWVGLGTGLVFSGTPGDDGGWALGELGGDLIVGGEFHVNDGANGANHLARWDGTSWANSANEGFGSASRVRDIEVTNAGAFVAGTFTTVGIAATGHDIPANNIAFFAEPTVTGITTARAPARLHQNYPNPFNPTTTIDFTVPSAGPVKLSIFDVRGKLVRVLADGYSVAGDRSLQWNGKDDRGVAVASGTYFYQLEANGVRSSRKMVLLK